MSSVGDRYTEAQQSLRAEPRTWLVTGVAGFIGSNLLEMLLGLGQRVVGLDNFATGHRRNLEEAVQRAGAASGAFEFIDGDIADQPTAARACRGVDVVLHHAAVGSVPHSITDPIRANTVNIDGFLTVLTAAKTAGVRRFVYASSAATYGDDPTLPKQEERIGRPLSPYAVTKRANELYAEAFKANFGSEAVGLRYFNVFGPRQDPDGAYAAVIPKWIARLLSGQACEIYGDGKTTRDFCYIDDVVQANVLAATAPADVAAGEVFNVAVGRGISLTELFTTIRDALATDNPELRDAQPLYREERPGDIRQSLADISKIRRGLGYAPRHSVSAGLAMALPWYREMYSATAQ